MKKLLMAGLFTAITSFLLAQKTDAIINAKEVKRIEMVLASDEMKGRKVYSPELDKAADFIAAEFKSAGLKTWNGGSSFRQEFAMVSPKQTSLVATFDNVEVDPSKVLVVTCQPEITINQLSGYETGSIKAGGNIFQQAMDFAEAKKNMIITVDSSYAKNFPRLSFLKRSLFKTDKNLVFILGNALPKNFTITARHDIKEQKLANVVGILPGKGKKDEYVIFSGHYDHIGIGKAQNGDSIYNGANDDAAGTTAVIMLAKYFAAQKNNERTLVFAAFTAEESGGYGSQYFSKQLSPDKVVAMFNIEMIGTESKWGKNSAYITGYEKTNMGSILQKNLEGTGFTFHPDPYPDQQLFYRSDNATLARLGVPAHTISTSKMDNEPNYHKVTDHVETLDLENMAMIIKSIALSSTSIVAGKETPSRVKKEDLR
ncbi:M20/M25/M40 family metallo-hydrolase [Terrimonas pollutisoli]|uniref:M20/M25/M40 family metallo-hydrolase n=1 Tax=Terrimonas pollutisoli TaxID=3034147 RepID=UPI0023EDBE76|nr:M20/M25/M40 family metallo-hydrolase [Terrimonas sp. H1YJ31]